jgi:uncharacterized membrane protein YdbT with pleckstrin-like domain
MGYVEQNLMPGEEIILKAKLYWAMFVSPIVVTLIGTVLLLGAMTINDDSGAALAFFAWFVILLGILSIIRTFVSYFSTEFAVTNKRIIAKTGLFRRRSLEMLLSKVESIGVNQPIMGRVLDYGTIVVAGTGGTKESFSNIVAPMDFRKRINAQIAGPVV